MISPYANLLIWAKITGQKGLLLGGGVRSTDFSLRFHEL